MTKLVDENVARAWCSGDQALVERLWRSFYQQFMQIPEHLSPSEAQELAHNLKNLAPYCGATQLGITAQQLAPPAPLPSQTQIAVLVSNLREVLAALQTRLPELKPAATDTHAEAREITMLWAVIELLQVHNFRALSAFKTWATEFALDWPCETIDDIEHALHRFDYKHAEGLLKAAYRAHGRYPAHLK